MRTITALNIHLCVSGLCDGGAFDTGVGGGESSRMSEKQRSYGSSNQVGCCSFMSEKFEWSSLVRMLIFTAFDWQDVLTRLRDQRQTDEQKEHGSVELPWPRVCRSVIAAPPALLLGSQEVWRVWPPYEWSSSQRNSGSHTGKNERFLSLYY